MNSQYQHAYCQVSGTPFEQGVQQGQELSDAIRRNLASVHRKLEQEKVDLQAYQAFVNQNLRFFQEQRPEMYEELQGIAQGSGLPLDDILLLNIPAYFLCESFRHITQECSMLCVRGQAAADGCTYIIKNRDMGMPMEQALVRHIYPDGQEIIEVGGAGILTYPAVGINSHGLAVTTTGFWSEKDPTRTERVEEADIFLNVRVLLTTFDERRPEETAAARLRLELDWTGRSRNIAPRLTRIDRVEEADIFLNVRVLLSSCRTAAQAVEFCRTAPRMNGLNVIAADPTEAYVIEMTSDEIYVEKDEGRGVLFRTNHVVSDQLSHFNPPEENYPSTHKRYDRIAQMVEERYGSLRFQDLYRIMSDHTNEPNCICRHPHEGVPATTVSTTLCVVEDREVWTTLQNPCLALPHVQIGEPSAQ